MQYEFRRALNAQRLLVLMGRPDLDSTKVAIHRVGDSVVVDFTDIPLKPVDEESLTKAMAMFDYNYVRQGPQVVDELTEERPRPTRRGVDPAE